MIYLYDDCVAVPKKEFEELKPHLGVFYGVSAVEQGNYVYLIPQQKSGVKPEYRQSVAELLMQNGYSEDEAKRLVEHNPLNLVVLAVVLASIAILVYYYREQVGQYLWNVFLPILTFGMAAFIGYSALK